MGRVRDFEDMVAATGPVAGLNPDRRSRTCIDDRMGRGMKARRDVDVGQSELFIGPLDGRLDVG